MSHANEVRMATWNIQSGGYADYKLDSEPVRELAISSHIDDLRSQDGIQGVGLVDAFGWRERYGHNAFIARHLGFEAARFVSLDDERLNEMYGVSPGIVFATDLAVHEYRELDLETRQGLGTILDLGRYGLQVATVYLDDMDEAVRMRQSRALVDSLEPGIPTILQGDFNTLRADMSGAALDTRLKNFGIEVLALLMPDSPLGLSMKGMNERSVIPFLESEGFNDGDSLRRPTAPAKLPAFGIDYVLHNDMANVDQVRVGRGVDASDHLSVSYRARF